MQERRAECVPMNVLYRIGRRLLYSVKIYEMGARKYCEGEFPFKTNCMNVENNFLCHVSEALTLMVCMPFKLRLGSTGE